MNRYGLGAETDGGYQDLALHKDTLVTVRNRQDSIITLHAYDEEDFRPAIDIGSVFLPRNVKVTGGKLRARPFVRIDGRKKAFRGPWVAYNLQSRHVEADE